VPEDYDRSADCRLLKMSRESASATAAGRLFQVGIVRCWLLLTVQDLLQKSDPANSQVDVAVLDFSKAFDKVPHTSLMSKLRSMGIDGKVLRWIKAFLDDRTQKVCVWMNTYLAALR